MRNKLLFSSVLLAASVSLSAQQSATITLHADQGKQIIPKEIYGQFAEHLSSFVLKSCARGLTVRTTRRRRFARLKSVGSTVLNDLRRL